MAQLLELPGIPGIPPLAVREAYGRLADEGLLAMDGNEGTWATGTGRAGTGQPVADPHPRLPLVWAEELRRTLESNPKPDGTSYKAWLTQTLRTHIKDLPPGTRLPPHRELAERLEDLGIPQYAPQRAYSQLAAEH